MLSRISNNIYCNNLQQYIFTVSPCIIMHQSGTPAGGCWVVVLHNIIIIQNSFLIAPKFTLPGRPLKACPESNSEHRIDDNRRQANQDLTS
jgi:hypothetical protein